MKISFNIAGKVRYFVNTNYIEVSDNFTYEVFNRLRMHKQMPASLFLIELNDILTENLQTTKGIDNIKATNAIYCINDILKIMTELGDNFYDCFDLYLTAENGIVVNLK